MSDPSTASRETYAASPDIFVTFKVAGLHCWPGAPDHRGYLRVPHRHQFGVRIETIVRHDDREIEFHDLRDRGLDLLRALAAGDGELLNFGPKSCEMIARDLGAELAAIFERSFRVTVDEDGECGATVETVFA